LQIKIKVEVSSALREPHQQQPAPLDKRKITMFVVGIFSLAVVIAYLLWPVSVTPNGLEPTLPEESDRSIAEKAIIQPILISQTMANSQVEQVVPDTKATTKLTAQALVDAKPASNELPMKVTAPAPIIEALAPQLVAPSIVTSTVKRALLTSAILQREPSDDLGHSVSLAQLQRVFYFTHLLASKGQVMQHRWYYKDKLQANVRLNIGSDNWRTYSSKALTNTMQGSWRVELVDTDNKVIDVHNFDVSH